ncbi:hypothetical protein L1987_35709 [Smallanthus sonchifolius]|uniref:Uncharacterized protein n=1 Tax=Smallanthus sonchifolius TaxID=185202 RepID=A0ACB9HCP4_9ASTR|nr:hypothetical protein L1987_35709 [Smallanthus sonchifolius]
MTREYDRSVFHIGLLLAAFCYAGDPFANYELEFSYITASPRGVPQQVIAVNGKFPGPTLNVTTNYDVVVNVKNKLDESLLVTWPGIEMRRSSWQDGVLGTNCPIPSNWNWTYRFQVKDQIGSYYYVPSINFQRAAGGFGGFVITNRKVIQLPFNTPDGDMVITIGDWYTQNHTTLRASLDVGKELGMPDGVLINGKGPFKYSSIVPDGINHTTLDVDSGPLPDPPNDLYDLLFALNQAMSIRMAYGNWTENSRGSYNRWDAIARSTTQVFPGGWTAILVYLDNVGAWNLRTVNLDRWYLDQETYIRIINPEDHEQKTELPVPDNVLFCGVLEHLQRPQRTFSSARSTIKELSEPCYLMLMAFAAIVYMMI